MVGSIYNMGVCDKGAAAGVNVHLHRTLEVEATSRCRHQETAGTLENGGCGQDPHIVVERMLVFLCILHCCMSIGRLQGAFIESRTRERPNKNTVAMQRELYWSRTEVKLGA